MTHYFLHRAMPEQIGKSRHAPALLPVLSVFQRNIVHFIFDTLVRRADDLVGVDQFLHPVCTPADDTRAGEHRGVELQRKIQHAVNEAAVEVDVCGYTFVNMALLADDLRSQFLDHSVQPVIFLSVFFFCQLLNEALKDARTRVGNGVNRMAHTVNQTFLVERLFVQQLS